MSVKYIIDISMLQEGDIVLTANKSMASKGIRLATLSTYSHAAIHVGGTLIEATLSGVFSKNPQRLIFDSSEHVAIYRYHRILTDDEKESICYHARSKVGSLYALPEAITVKARSALKMKETRKQFCSRLVALAYSENHIDLKNLRYPAYCTPKQLSLCKAFSQVKGIIKEASQAEIDFLNNEDPLIKNQESTFSWLNKTRRLVENENLSNIYDIQTVNDVSDFLLEKPNFDKEICNYLDETDYLTNYNFDIKNNPYRYNSQALYLKTINFGNPIVFLENELKKEYGIVDNYIRNLNNYLEAYSRINLNYHSKHCILYINLLNGIFIRMHFLNEVSKKIGAMEVSNKSYSIMVSAAEASGVAKKALGL